MRATILEHKTWMEAEMILRSAPTCVLPLGAGLKEHGPHLPLNNDRLLADYLAAEVAKHSEVVILPTMAYGYYPAFIEYPGSISIDRNAMMTFFLDVARSLARHGVTRLYVLNTGISTCRSLEPARLELGKENILMHYTDLSIGLDPIEKKYASQRAGSHADEVETSMMLHIAPKVVDMSRAKKDIHPRKSSGPFTRNIASAHGLYSPTGAYGDPTLATQEKGEKILAEFVEFICEDIAVFSSNEYRAAPPRTEYLNQS